MEVGQFVDHLPMNACRTSAGCLQGVYVRCSSGNFREAHQQVPRRSWPTMRTVVAVVLTSLLRKLPGFGHSLVEYGVQGLQQMFAPCIRRVSRARERGLVKIRFRVSRVRSLIAVSDDWTLTALK